MDVARNADHRQASWSTRSEAEGGKKLGPDLDDLRRNSAISKLPFTCNHFSNSNRQRMRPSMAATNGAIPARQPHVPAWKRLGLKLKFAKDTFEPPSQTQQPQHSAPSPVSQTRTPPSDVKANDDRPSKKRKTFMESSRASPPNSRGHENRASLNSSSRLGNFEPSGGAVVRASVESEPFVNAV